MWMLQTPKFLHCRIKNSYNADSTISSLQTQQLLHCRLHNFSTADPKTSRSCTPQVHNHLKVAMADETHTPPAARPINMANVLNLIYFWGNPFLKVFQIQLTEKEVPHFWERVRLPHLLLSPPGMKFKIIGEPFPPGAIGTQATWSCSKSTKCSTRHGCLVLWILSWWPAAWGGLQTLQSDPA